MFKNQYELSVDIKKKMSAIVPTFVQYDHAVLIFRIFDNGKKFDLNGFTKAEVSHRKPDGTVEIGNAVIEGTGGNQWIKYTYYGTEMDQLGYVDTSLSLHSNDKKVSIQAFKVNIVVDLAEQYASPANPQVGALQQLIATVEKLKTDTEKAKNEATTQASHAKTQGDYAKTQGNYAKLHGDNAKTHGDHAKAQGDAAQAEKIATQAVREATQTLKTETEKVKTDTVLAKDATVAATRLAIEAAEAVHSVVDEWKYVDKYDLSKTYVKNNIVAYNGSSYIALKNNIGAPPTGTVDDDNWSLVARKGEDANGIVVLHKQFFSTSAGQTEFTLANEYDQMQNRVRVIVDGVEQFSPTNFLELTSNKIKFNTPLPSDAEVVVVYFGNAPAIANDIQLQLDNIKDTLSFLNLETIGDATKFATQQGNYAKSEGDKVASKITEVNTAISDVEAVKQAATTATVLATSSAGTADIAASNANNKATLAQSATDNATTATNTVNLLIPNIQGMENKGEYRTETQYKKNNIVEYNGSSYQALKDTIGNRPPTLPVKANEFWSILAQRGIDGSGSVVTVNRISPDIDGNVDLGNLATDWNSIEGKPLEFNPAEHPISKVTGLQNTLDSKETPTGAKAKADTAETNAKTHADTELLKKVDKVVGKGLSTEDYTSGEKSKLAGIESGANNYVHPANHPATMIVQDSSNRMVTDVQITSWNGKSNFDGKYSSLTGIPTTFAPSTHTHTIANVTGLQTALDAKETPSGAQAKVDTHKSTVASPSVLGHVKVGQNLTITPDGTLNASGGTVPDASTTQKGVVQLNNTLTSTSANQAATANAVKQLNDLKANKSQESYITISPINGWSAIAPIQCYKDEFGVVRVTGYLVGGNKNLGMGLFTLPQGYHPSPATNAEFMLMTSNSTNDSHRVLSAFVASGSFMLAGNALNNILIDVSFRV